MIELEIDAAIDEGTNKAIGVTMSEAIDTGRAM
jgi:hypothetical protein